MANVTLRVIDGADRGRVFAELGTPITIGREEGNIVQLNDDRVSRFHLKIQEDQDRLVLTDLESTNGTKVNGEEIQLRILRHGDMICVGRSMLLYGSPLEIQGRMASLRGSNIPSGESQALSSADSSVSFDLNWQDEEDLQATIHVVEPPELPTRMSPAQAAQMSELLEYLHIRIRQMLNAATMSDDDQSDSHVVIPRERWQHLLDLQARLASYLKRIGEPEDE